MNAELTYLYRDGGNHKKFGSVIFSNLEQVNCSESDKTLTEAFLEDGLFIADQVRVPDVFLFAKGNFSYDDHCYHEFGSVRITDKEPNDVHARTLCEFMAEVVDQGQRGWRVFDPYDSEGSFGHLMATQTDRRAH